MRRREFVALLSGSVAWPIVTQAQQTSKAPVIGLLHPGTAALGSPTLDSLREGFRDAGYIEGETIKLEARWGDGKPETLRGLAKELVQARVALIVATARPSIEAARAATRELPIVCTDLESDPVAIGFVASIAKPGGNITGLFLDAPAICGKWLQQMREIVPTLNKAALLWDSTTGMYQLEAIKTAAKTMSIELIVMEFRDADGISTALKDGLKQGPQAVIQLGSPLISQAGKRIAETLASYRVPGISPFRTFTAGGGLISYGPDLAHMYRRIAPYIFKILHGARPAELPVERPTKFDLVINLTAAKTIGIEISPSMMSRADEVIE